jgi:hypothetical protein
MKVSKLATSIFVAAEQYTKLRDRVVHPDGEFDKQGRFSLTTRCECCEGIRSPSRAHPFSQMVHARTLVHVATEAELTDYIKVIRSVAKVIDKSGAEAANELLASKPFAKQLTVITKDVKAAKAAARAAKAEKAANPPAGIPDRFDDDLPF